MTKGLLGLVSRTRIGLCLLLLAAIGCFTVPAFASGAAHSAITTHLLRPGVAAIADLDGDKLPDVASGINTGHTSSGYSYRVDFDLTGNTQQKSFSVFSEEPNGLNIEAIDIDGDHDLDLVITGRLSRRPIGIWINDGSGSFTQGDLEQYVLPVWQARQSIQSPNFTSTPAVQFESRRPQMALRHERLSLRTSKTSPREIASSSSGPSRTPAGSTRLRAPPLQNI